MPTIDMPVIDWPTDLLPTNSTGLRWQPHVGGSESPLTRTRKTYGLSAPRWTMNLGFSASRFGGEGVSARGPRLDAMLAELDGGQVLVRLWDFHRPYPVGLARYYSGLQRQRWGFSGGEIFTGGEMFTLGPVFPVPTSEAAAQGATTIAFGGFVPGAVAFDIGDYIGLLGRPRIILRAAIAGADGRAVAQFKPPLESAVSAGAAVIERAPGVFQLSNTDAGAGDSSRSQSQAGYSFQFVEWLP
ncbi:hypothetical protein [Sphingomonas hengshuiensis]|uniref:Uncharacterized protein n=1 Tax=Sphingomonas hengshuiensis TaxID=1609977 RepID=A0A7U4J8N5_9SPHN|nr:hypothetical protein [Sphingomonas hengshuiensis]AJP72266.1 hypothetical protein TS85_11405 [Sphingomonas hengshuiensis]